MGTVVFRATNHTKTGDQVFLSGGTQRLPFTWQFIAINISSSNSSFRLHSSIQYKSKYLQALMWNTLTNRLWYFPGGVSVFCYFIPCSDPVLSHGKKCLWWTRIWWMSHESESARDSPYGLKLLEAIWTVSGFLSVSGWSIIIKVYKSIFFTQFHINQSQLNKWSKIRQSMIFLIDIQGIAAVSTTFLAALTVNHEFSKQYSHINGTESNRLANGCSDPTEMLDSEG